MIDLIAQRKRYNAFLIGWFCSVAELDVNSLLCTHPSVVLSPALDILVWVRPQQVAQKPGVGNVGGSHDPSDLLHALEIRTETSVTTEDLLVHNGCDGQTVEAVSEGFPQFDVVASLACDEMINNVDFTLT